MREDSLLRVTPVSIPAGVGQITEIDVSGVVSLYVTKSVSLGTTAAEVAIAFGDQGDFMDLVGGDSFENFIPVKKIRLRNSTAVEKRLELLLTINADFKFRNAPRGI